MCKEFFPTDLSIQSFWLYLKSLNLITLLSSQTEYTMQFGYSVLSELISKNRNVLNLTSIQEIENCLPWFPVNDVWPPGNNYVLPRFRTLWTLWRPWVWILVNRKWLTWPTRSVSTAWSTTLSSVNSSSGSTGRRTRKYLTRHFSRFPLRWFNVLWNDPKHFRLFVGQIRIRRIFGQKSGR